jgi:hypothetical protein
MYSGYGENLGFAGLQNPNFCSKIQKAAGLLAVCVFPAADIQMIFVVRVILTALFARRNGKVGN